MSHSCRPGAISTPFLGLAALGLHAYPGRTRQLMFGLMLLVAGIECTQALTGWRQGD